MANLRGAFEVQSALGPTLFFMSLLPQFFFHSAQTQPRPAPTPIAFKRVSEQCNILNSVILETILYSPWRG